MVTNKSGPQQINIPINLRALQHIRQRIANAAGEPVESAQAQL